MNVTAGNRTNRNLTKIIQKIQDQFKIEYVYRIPLKYLCKIGLVNQCFKFNTKYILTLQPYKNYLRQIQIKQQMLYLGVLMQIPSLCLHLESFFRNT